MDAGKFEIQRTFRDRYSLSFGGSYMGTFVPAELVQLGKLLVNEFPLELDPRRTTDACDTRHAVPRE